MIERAVIGGRPASVVYLTEAFEPTEQNGAAFVKVRFDDGEVMFATPGETAAKFYSETQPRAPAGSPEGGQWVSEGGAGITAPAGGSGPRIVDLTKIGKGTPPEKATLPAPTGSLRISGLSRVRQPKEKLPEGASPVAAKLHEFEQKHADSAREHCRVLAPDGTILGEKVGGSSEIKFNVYETGKWENKDAIFIHNHPNGTALSGRDALTAMKWNLSEIQAVGYDHHTGEMVRHVLKRPAGGWPNEYVRDQIADFAQQFRSRYITETRGKVVGGEMTMYDANRIGPEQMWKEIGEKFRLDYTITRTKFTGKVSKRRSREFAAEGPGFFQLVEGEDGTITLDGPDDNGPWFTPEDLEGQSGELFYSEDQPRDDRGRWTETGAGEAGGTTVAEAEPWQMSRDEFAGEYPKQEPGEPDDRWLDRTRAHRQKEQEWEQAVLAAVSEGRLSVAEANERKLWTATEKEWQALPPVLYHVTTAADAVEREGLKSRFELSQGSGHGLGGGDDKSISFTESRETAEAIRDAFREAHDVLNGNVTIAEMVEDAKKGWGAKEPYDELAIRINYGPSYKHGDEIPKTLALVMAGKDFYFGFDPNRNDYYREKGTWTDEGKGLWTRPMSVEEQRDAAFDFYRGFAAAREHAGGKLDPLFFSSDRKALAGLDVGRDVAVMEYRPVPGAKGTRMSALGEWRTYTGKAVKLVRRHGR